MGLYKLAKLAIKGSLLLLGLVFMYEIGEAYYLSNAQPFEIYLNPAHYHLHLSNYSPAFHKYTEQENYGNKDFHQGEIYAYDYQGSKFLIKVKADNLKESTPPKVTILEDADLEWSVLTSISENIDEEIIISWYNDSSHWLSFLFKTEVKQLHLKEIVNDYIPNGKWVSSNNPFQESKKYMAAGDKISGYPFQLNINSEDYQNFLRQFEQHNSYELEDSRYYAEYRPSTKIAISYNGQQALLEAMQPIVAEDEFSFYVTNAAAPNQWIYTMRDNKRYHYGLTVNDPNVTIYFNDRAYTIEEIFEGEMFNTN